MKRVTLFKNKQNYITNLDILRSLEKVKSYDCKILYIHSEINFGIPNPNLDRKKILSSLFHCIKKLGVQTLCIPTYTFSFCNKEIFDVKNSRSKMGAFSEFVRQDLNSERSNDPLLSVTVFGKDKSIIKNLSKNTTGKNSHFYKIYKSKNVKFLFFGPKVSNCFTYMHFIERQLSAPYRYDKIFKGKLKKNNKIYGDSYKLFVRYNGVEVGNGANIFEEKLYKKKISLRQHLGAGLITCFDETKSHDFFCDLFKENYNIFLKRPFKNNSKDTTYNFNNVVTL